MSIGITQLILIIIIGIILFGNIPKLFRDVGTGIAAFRNISRSSNSNEVEGSEEKEKSSVTKKQEESAKSTEKESENRKS